LCVDTRKVEAFSEEYDYPLGAIVADVLYPFLTRLADSVEAPQQANITSARVSVPNEKVEQPTEKQGVSEHHEQ
jgi:hypothetical protein